ncbi:MAG TPA: LPS assembly protein LptD [Verrucomicrobiota bacterium]|nr:LPS assembly protein LptD [Verrucomicrobiota bacterium]HNU52364.1 LPS assembly protein LptD [Verrucomicrobiota bacterium]
MSRWRWTPVLLALVLVCTGQGADRPEEAVLEIHALSDQGTLDYDENTGILADPAGIRVTYGDASLTALRIVLNRDTTEVQAEGNVHLERGTELWTGDRLEYNFQTRSMRTGAFRTGMRPFFAAGEGLEGDIPAQTHSATNAFVTTDDVAEPGYRVKARQLTFVPGKYLEARHATLYLGKVPVFYFPKYRRHFDRHPNHWVVLPGYRSLYGPFLLNTYHWSIATNLSADLHLDYRYKRGVAGGPDFFYNLGRWGQGEFKAYALHDDDPDVDELNRPIDPDRYRIRFAHSAYLLTNLTAQVSVNAMSDAQMLRDFFEAEYRNDVQPKSFVELDKFWSNFSLNLYVQPQVNDFDQTVERLPDVKLTGLRQQLGVTPVFYESESSMGYYRFRGGDFAPATNHAALRADTYHELLLPQTLGGWLNVTPRIGGRYTVYGDDEGDDATLLANQERWVLHTGAEVSAKASRLWPTARSRLLDVRGLRHILEPSVNYVYVPNPSREPTELPQFDYELQTFELLPIDFPNYNNIDSIDSQNVIRFGLHQKLQTKRDGTVDDLLRWAAFVDWRLRPRSDQQTWGDAYSDLQFKPRSWFTLDSELRYDINTTTWRMANHTATLEPNDQWSLRLGHRYLRELPGEGPDSGNNLILSSLAVRLSENWGVRLRHHYEARDGTLEEQYYTLYRDLRSVTAALTLRLRDNRTRDDDVTIAFMLSLKASPRFRLGQDRDQPSLLLGY